MKHASSRPPSLTTYTKDHCRCDECCRVWREYGRQHARDRYHGITRLVPADDAVRHVRNLIHSGMSRDAVADAAGLDRLVVKRIMLGRQARLNRRSEDAIMSVPLGTVLPQHRVPAVKAIRLMDEMKLAGVGASMLRRDCNIASPSNIRKQKTVRPKTWQRLVTVYRYLAREGRVPASVLDEVGA